MTRVFYLILLCGLLLLTKDSIWSFIRPSIDSLKCKKTLLQSNRIIKKIAMLFWIIHPEWSDEQTKKCIGFFLFGSLALFLCGFYVLARQGYGLPALSISGVLGLLPYFYLRMSVINRQISGSYEGQILLSEIINQYKLNHLNAAVAIERSIAYLDKAPVSQKLLYQMALRLKTYQTDNDLHSVLNDFADRCNTQWASMLANNLYYAISMDANVTMGLTDLLNECTYTQKIIEQSKRQNNEAFVMIQLLCPAVYVVLIWSLITHFDFTIADIIHYQLFTPTGALLFMIMVIGIFLGLIFSKMLSRPKFDV